MSKTTPNDFVSVDVPRLVQFASSQKDYERLDEIQALNTALCYLCSINADVAEVEAFLHVYPESLLLEGTNPTLEESARFALLTQTCCCCGCRDSSSSCQRNRKAILDHCLSQDFVSFHRQKRQHYQERWEQQQQHPLFWNHGTTVTVPQQQQEQQWNKYRQKLILVEQNVRHWRREEWNVRQRLLELAMERCYEYQAKQQEQEQQEHCEQKTNKLQERQQQQQQQQKYRHFLRFFSCMCCFLRDYHHRGGSTTRRAGLQTRTRTTTTNHVVGKEEEEVAKDHNKNNTSATIRMLRERHQDVLLEIKRARQVQYRLLKHLFHGVKCHSCSSSVN